MNSSSSASIQIAASSYMSNLFPKEERSRELKAVDCRIDPYLLGLFDELGRGLVLGLVLCNFRLVLLLSTHAATASVEYTAFSS